jgi:hypothetical protein
MSQWLLIMKLMHLILIVCFLTPPIHLEMPNFPARQQDPSALLMRSDYGMAFAKPKKNRFEKLATAIAKAQNN